MGFIALSFMLGSVVSAGLLFQIAKVNWKTPLPINLLGAFFYFFTTLSLTGWVSSLLGLFSNATFPSFPETPFINCAQFALMTAMVYAMPVAFRKGLAWVSQIGHRSNRKFRAGRLPENARKGFYK